MSSSEDGGSRVSIPADLRKTIQNIREVTGKQHSDEDIFSVFKECFNDPHETTQKLLYLDTFHEVRSKRERKKENFVPSTQERGRNARRHFPSSYNAHHASNGGTAASQKQTGASSRTKVPPPNKALNNTKPSSMQAPNFISPQSGTSIHKTQDALISPVNKRVTKEHPLSKSTSSEEVSELDKSKARTVPLAVSDSIVENDTQCAIDGTSQISQNSEPVIRSEAAASTDNNQSLLKSYVGERPHVTFPVHLQVAKLLENGLTFGSFDSNFVKETSSDNGTIDGDDSNIKSSHETEAYGASPRKDKSFFSQDKDQEISSSISETELALQSDKTVHLVEDFEGDKLKEEILPIKDTNQASTSDATPISYREQYAIAASQQQMHLFRQQYPLNFFPCGPYFPPFYMPQPYIPQFLSPNGVQQQSYLPPGDDAPALPGAKFPLTHIKSGSDNGNSPPTAIPSPYDSYAFNHIPSAATMNSSHKEEKKENIYSTGPLISFSLPLASVIASYAILF